MSDAPLENKESPSLFQTTYMETSDKRTLRIATFDNKRHRQKGTVIFLQGMCDKLERYTDFFSDLVERGFSYASFDWFSQQNGRKGIKNAHLAFDINQHIADLDEFLHTIVYPDCPPPYYFVCYDMGCLIALSALDIINNQCSRFIGISPLFCPLGYKIGSMEHKLILLMNDLGFGRLKLKHGKMLLETIHSPDENNSEMPGKRYQTQSAVLDRRWLANILNAAKNAHEHLKKNDLRFPTLFLVGRNEKCSDNREIRHFCENVRLADIITLFGADYDILRTGKLYQKQFWAIFDAFIHCGKCY